MESSSGRFANHHQLVMETPVHVTGFWSIHEAGTLANTGSTGAGLVLRPLIRVVVSRSSKGFRVLLGDEDVTNICVVRSVLRRILTSANLEINIQTNLPLGAGFGLSAVIAISTVVAASMHSGSEATLIDLLKVAHESEVECRTGLGDVIALYHGGGLEIRVKPGAPGIGEVLRYPVDENLKVVASVVGGKMTTPMMLSLLRDKINKYGAEALRKLLKRPCLEDFLTLANEFSRRTGMLSGKLMEKIRFLDRFISRGCVLGYYLKKNVLVVVVDGEDAAMEIKEIIESNLGAKSFITSAYNSGLKVYMQ